MKTFTYDELKNDLKKTIDDLKTMIKNGSYSKDETKELKQLLSDTLSDFIYVNRIGKYSSSAQGFSLQEIGDIMNISRERVRQIEQSAIRKLRSPSIGRTLREYLEEAGVFNDKG